MYDPTNKNTSSVLEKRVRGSRLFKFLLCAGFLVLLYHLTLGNRGFDEKSSWVGKFILQKSSFMENYDPFLEEIEFVQNNFETMEQTDPRLIRYVRSRYMTPPPPKDKPRHMKRGNSYQKTELGKWVRKFYNNKRGGVFIETGAYDGEVSHTIELEMELGWSGVLIECNPRMTPLLKDLARKTWLGTVCISLDGYPKTVNMSVPDTWMGSARLGPAVNLTRWGIHSNFTYFDGLESVPLYSILASIGLKEIDYFTFDIEGTELAVFKTFPFDKILFKVLILEVHFYTDEEKIELKELLGRNGLIFIRDIDVDQIYVHESLLNRNGVGSAEQLARL